MKELVKFVECAQSPGLQPWIAGCSIYMQCKCGQTFSYNTPGASTHWSKYEIRAPRPRAKRWDVFYNECKEVIENNPAKYLVPDWTE